MRKTCGGIDMEKQFVTYEIALKLKELGFNDPCFAYWFTVNGKNPQISKRDIHFNGYKNYSDSNTIAPLWQQVIDWLRIQHCTLVHPFYRGKYEYMVESSIETASSGVIVEGENWNDAREKAVLKAFELIKTNGNEQ